jgi:hypothetical protein
VFLSAIIGSGLQKLDRKDKKGRGSFRRTRATDNNTGAFTEYVWGNRNPYCVTYSVRASSVQLRRFE